MKSYRTMIYLHPTSEGNANKLLNNNNSKIKRFIGSRWLEVILNLENLLSAPLGVASS